MGPFRLTPLAPGAVEEDYAVVIESADVLFGIFGNEWPRGLTLEKNLEDLARHDREFAAEFAFSWIVRSLDGTYLGCAYLNPEHEARGVGRIVTWIRARPDRIGLLTAFNAIFADWLTPHLPEGYRLNWVSNGAEFSESA